jgi:hypothetical protein
MKFFRFVKIGLVCLLLFIGISTVYVYARNTEVVENTDQRLSEKVTEAFDFCKKNGYNTDFCILIDMKIHSGKNRMFVWDFKNKEIDRQSLCTHGCGKGDKRSTGANPLFSNEEGSRLSSLGKYRLGARSYSQWGINIHYKMYGLETTNNNALKRIVVLHSHNPVPETEIYPRHLPMGWSFGCAITDDNTMRYLDSKLKNVKKPVLLWIYY